MSESTQQYKPGDIANGYVLGQDGSWQPLPLAAPAAPMKKKHRVRNVTLAVAAVATIYGIAQASSGGDDDASSTTGTYADTRVADDKADAPKTDAPADQAVEEAPAEDDGPDMTAGQENAVGSAQDYLDYSAFSRKGLIDQLKYEGYSVADANFAVDHIKVDWNEQAVASAKDYLDYDSFSHKGLVDQLEYEGFTPEQAEYGVSHAGL